VPDLSIATIRCRHYSEVLEQRGEDGPLSEAERALLIEQEACWHEESCRLRELSLTDFWAAHAHFEGEELD
jgi:hypothetical protein